MDIGVNDHCNNAQSHQIEDDLESEIYHPSELQHETIEDVIRIRHLQIHDSEDDVLVESWNGLQAPNCGGCEMFNANRQIPDGVNATGSSPVQFNRFTPIAVLSEDLRISKILRRLMIETNRKTAVELCRKLDAAVRNQSNASYICRSFDILFDNMVTVLRQCPPECLESASSILGVMGYINRYDFDVYQNNLKNCYINNKSLRQYLMMALRTTISCDAVNLDLKPYSDRLLSVIKEYLENAEVAENFIAISETIAELSKHYKQSFHRHFTDIVDIIIGWHLEIEQPATLKRHCGKILQQFSEYFLGKLDFTLGLLGQFIEDIEVCGDEVIAEDVSVKSKQQIDARVGAFIGAFTSIMKAMISKGVILNNFTPSANIVQEAKRVVNKVAKQCFNMITLVGEETVINLNEFYCVITYDKSVENLCDLERIIELQLNHLCGFNENQISSFLYMILHVVRQYRTQLPLSFVSLIMNKDNVCLQELKLNCGLKSYRLFLKIYHEILIIKNVPLLQEAYRHILKDVNETVGYLKLAESSIYSMARSELILSFYLAALSAMACQTSSIIGMYALNPSILELLITNCQAANESLWKQYPTLHQALLAVIKEHSSKNYNFRQSSRLLVHNQDSPTAENFSIILKFLATILRWHISSDLQNWLDQLLKECRDDFAILTEKDDFLQMCENITILAKREPTLCSGLLRSILQYNKMPDFILCNIRDIVLYAFEGTNQERLPFYAELLALLPLEISLTTDNESDIFYEDKERLIQLQHWHKSTICFNTLRSKYFKSFIESLDANSTADAKELMYQAFAEKSFVHLHRESVDDYLNTLQCNKRLLKFHLQYEAARYCVQQKLRTTLGKPQETFLAIESIIMKYARFLAEKTKATKGIDTPLDELAKLQENCRMLLGFLESLEKHIYNAAEGTAIAMLPAEKPARTFFRVNSSTCNEWFKRIRTAVNLIALHCMEPEMVIRYSESILQSDAAFTNKGFLDRTITSMVWALFACGEAEALYGVQTWLKSKHCKGYEWIQHVAEHASGHFEKAATGYKSILGDDAAKNMDLFMKEFLQQQLSDCLCHTARWDEIKRIGLNTNYLTQHLESMETIYRNAMRQSDDMENEELSNALQKMTEWAEEYNNNEKLQNKVESFSYYEILQRINEACLVQAVSRQNGTPLEFESIGNCIRQSLREYVVDSNENVFNELILLNHVSYNLQHDENFAIHNTEITISPRSINHILNWSMIMGAKSNNTNNNLPLLLSMASVARNQNNLSYSQKLLENFFTLKGIEKSYPQIIHELKSNELEIDCWDPDLVRGVEELIKCMHAENNSSLDALEVASTCCAQIIQKHGGPAATDTVPDSTLNLLLTMADWLSGNRLPNSSLAQIAQCQQFQKLQNLLPSIDVCAHSEGRNKSFALPTTEYSVGKLLNASILCNANSGGAWFFFGNWCYRWGKKLMETSGEQCDIKELKMTNRNIASIQDILGEKVDDGLTLQVVELLNTHMVNAIKDDNVDDNEYSHNAREALECEMKKICTISTEQLNSIICIWCQAHKGVYGFYEEATKAYFKYLAIESDATSMKSKSKSNTEIENTFVTLRLLRLIVKHATGLQDALEEGLRNTPLRPWKVIIPQLFSRLNHHENYVRRSVSDLLCRLAVNQPQLIIFPAVVGAQQEQKNCVAAESQKQLSNCFVALLNSLSSQAPNMVLQVQMLVCELRRITLLWEEYWIHSLAQLYAEYSHLYNALEAESRKSTNRDALLIKYDIFRKHLLKDFERIVEATEKEAETNYERNFQERFRHHIEIVRKELTKPTDTAQPSEYWQKIKQLYSIFQQRPLRGSSSTIRISDVSPVLANMRNTTISMPGVDTYEKPAVFIKSVESTIYILPTKTKPKKLSFCGSNGQTYTYLFKGQEDLHLDERIMQFLSISNSMMSRSYGSKATIDCFKAHHYSVIPLGTQSGLISWVDHCTPLFAIYKKWQQREALLKQQQKERQNSKSYEPVLQSPTAAATSRPSELFYNKLTPLLAERNMKVSDPRKQWPIAILKRVLRELSSETPGDLLAKEIWCYSTNSVDWRKSVRRYTMSMAVMSIIGYVIGLGDRHLDNILIKLGTGEIVHIDYNVCFEKGKSLRVPEKVPFRMSQNLKGALGLVGTEGSYRLACSHVLRVLRRERETLLTLLEAFVYDPLVDWTLSDDGNSTRGTSANSAAIMITSLCSSKEYHLSPRDVFKGKKSDTDLSRQTLTLKISEVRPAWLQYKDDLDYVLRNVKDHVERMLDVRQQILRFEEKRDNYTKQLAMIRELDALGSARGSHALNTVTQRYKAYKRDLSSFDEIKSLVRQTVTDLDIVVSTYFDILLAPSEIRNIEINDGGLPHSNECAIVKTLLAGNSENKYYTPIEFAKHEINNSFIQIQRNAIECRDLLLFYGQLMRFYPRSKLQQNHLVKYLAQLKELVDVPSTVANPELPSTRGCEEDTHGTTKTCVQYFKNMQSIHVDLQTQVVQAQQVLKQRQQEQLDKITVPQATDEILNLNRSPLHILKGLRQRLDAVHKAFVAKEKELFSSNVCFLLNHRISFLLFVERSINCLSPAHVPKLLRTLIHSLVGLRDLKDSMEDASETLFALMTNETIPCCQEINANEYYKSCPAINVIFEETDNIFKDTVARLQGLQDSLTHMREIHPTAAIQQIKNVWSINILEYMESCRTDVMLKIISEINDSSLAMTTNDVNNILDIQRIRRPINDMMVKIQSKLFEGLLSLVMECIHASIGNSIADVRLTDNAGLTEVNSVLEKLFHTLEHERQLQYDEDVVLYYSKLLDQYHFITNFYFWLHESHLIDADSNLQNLKSKKAFITALHNASQDLSASKSKMIKTQKDVEFHRSLLRDFLLSSLVPSAGDLQKLDDAVAAEKERYEFFLSLATRLTEYSTVLLQFEVSGENKPFESLVRKYNEERSKLQTCETAISLVERNLVQLLDPEDNIDNCWIKNISELLDEMIFSAQKEICDFEKVEANTEAILQDDGQKLQQVIVDSSIRGDMRQLLKMLTKSYRLSKIGNGDHLFQDIRDIQHTMKLLQNKLNDLQLQLLSGEFETVALMQLHEKVDELLTLCHNNNIWLKSIIERLGKLYSDDGQNCAESPTRNESSKDVGANNSQLGEQKRNAYAVSVWKRIRMKLEGRDPDPNRRSSVAEQVEYVIAEATSEDNLASLYEGWTPWV
ncbi:serine/threonine-protein kinase Smg1 isoform X1 [Stomoxys calcitrans]|uniref:serine/threonine-protein kinase Smg1 isoform X1 n=1 Tax=Stomoxys calcitrans TaxID=35570 RepID=UPI0027E32B93|nr:serine/threonine-protein kinase Smg1 isoform X1 [Stomoxys calcitrans]